MSSDDGDDWMQWRLAVLGDDHQPIDWDTGPDTDTGQPSGCFYHALLLLLFSKYGWTNV